MKIITEIQKIMAGAITISIYRNGDFSLKKISINNFIGVIMMIQYHDVILQQLIKLFN